MLAASGYKTKKELKESIGEEFGFTETSMFGPEYDPKRKWFAQVWLKDGKIVKVT
jgi:hypothetical protein